MAFEPTAPEDIDWYDMHFGKIKDLESICNINLFLYMSIFDVQTILS